MEPLSPIVPAKFDIRSVPFDTVRALFANYHSYGEPNGKFFTYRFAVFEGDRVVAAYLWNPPAPGLARKVCPEEPQAVLTLSRMVAAPRAERALKHISKPLKYQMKYLIDRTRWPVLVTQVDLGEGHNGYVYECSGFTRVGTPTKVTHTVNVKGDRISTYSCGKTSAAAKDNIAAGRKIKTELQLFEHRVCPPGQADKWWEDHGWVREPIPGKVWASGNPRYSIVKIPSLLAAE